MSFHSVVSPKKQAKSSGNGGVLSRSLARSKWTCFFVGPWGKHSLTDPGGELGHPVACIRPLLGHVLLIPLLPDSPVGPADEVCSKSSATTHLCSVGVMDLKMARYACGVLWKCREVPNLLVGTLVMAFAAALCSYSLCYGAVSSLTGSHLLATWATSFLLPSTEG